MVINHKFPVIATGLSGLVGSRLGHLLGKEFSFIDLSLDTGVDITSFNQLKQIFEKNRQISTLVHLAAFTDVNTAWEQRGDKKGACYQVNVIGTRNLARLCAESNRFLIHFSTDFVFDGKNPPEGGYTENDSPSPIEWYGQTKFLAEKEVKESGVDYCLLRIAFPFKAKPEPKTLEPASKLDLVRKIFQWLKEDSLPAMFSDQIITPTFIDDIVRVVAICLKKKIKGLYHCVGSSSLSPYLMAREIADHFGFDKEKIKAIKLEEYLNQLNEEDQSLRPRQKNLILSNQKIQKETGVQMKTFPQALSAIKTQLQRR